MAVTLGSRSTMPGSPDSIVKFRENGVMTEFLVMHHGRPSAMYDESFDDGTVIVRKDIHGTRQWHSSDVNDYANSTINAYLNGEYLNLFDTGVRGTIKQVKIPYRPGTSGTAVNSGANGLPVKIWLLGTYELNWTDAIGTGVPVDGAALSYFTGTAVMDTKRIAYLNSVATEWTLRTPRTVDGTRSQSVATNGNYNTRNCSTPGGIRPALVLPSSLLVSDTGEIIFNQPPSKPTSISVPPTAISTQKINVSWLASTDPEGDPITYVVEHSANGGSYAQAGETATLSFSETVSASWDTIRYRVKARDSFGNESDYTESDTVTVIHNQPPEITDEDEDLGTYAHGFTYAYTVTDPEDDLTTVTEKVGDQVIREYTAQLGRETEAEVTGNVFLGLANGPHTLTITARNYTGSEAVRTLTFTKMATAIFITLSEPLLSSEQPQRAYIDVVREIPAGATFLVEITNNPYDPSPVWEDCTGAVVAGHPHVFQNKTNAALETGLNVRVTVERKNAIGPCWVASIGGGFE